MTGQARSGPLVGLRVLSVAENFPGPYATMLLADLGADVVTVERPNGGDAARRFGTVFASLNRNKRSIALDLKDPDAREALLKLAERADVLVEGYRPGTADRLGIDYSVVRKRAPRLIYVSISGYGQTGPYRARPGHDLSFGGVAGAVAASPSAGHEVVPLADLSSALFAAIGTLAALSRREHTGAGTHVDVSMTDSMVASLATVLGAAWNPTVGTGLPPSPPGYGVFAAADGRQLTLSVVFEDHLWSALCEALELPGVAALTFAARLERTDELQAQLARALASRSRAEWIEILAAAGVPFGPVNELEEVWRDPQIQAREVAVEVDGQRYVRQPLRFEGDPPDRISDPPPRLGQHTAELLLSVGIDGATIAALRARGAIV